MPAWPSTFRSVVSDRRFRRFMLLMVLLSLVRLMFQHMHFTWPKSVTRVEGDSFPVGTVWSLNPLGVLFLVPLATALARRLPIFPVLLLGATISALSPFLLCCGAAHGPCRLHRFRKAATRQRLTADRRAFSPHSGSGRRWAWM